MSDNPDLDDFEDPDPEYGEGSDDDSDPFLSHDPDDQIPDLNFEWLGASTAINEHIILEIYADTMAALADGIDVEDAVERLERFALTHVFTDEETFGFFTTMVDGIEHIRSLDDWPSGAVSLFSYGYDNPGAAWSELKRTGLEEIGFIYEENGEYYCGIPPTD